MHPLGSFFGTQAPFAKEANRGLALRQLFGAGGGASWAGLGQGFARATGSVGRGLSWYGKEMAGYGANGPLAGRGLFDARAARRLAPAEQQAAYGGVPLWGGLKRQLDTHVPTLYRATAVAKNLATTPWAAPFLNQAERQLQEAGRSGLAQVPRRLRQGMTGLSYLSLGGSAAAGASRLNRLADDTSRELARGVAQAAQGGGELSAGDQAAADEHARRNRWGLLWGLRPEWLGGDGSELSRAARAGVAEELPALARSEAYAGAHLVNPTRRLLGWAGAPAAGDDNNAALNSWAARRWADVGRSLNPLGALSTAAMFGAADAAPADVPGAVARQVRERSGAIADNLGRELDSPIGRLAQQVAAPVVARPQVRERLLARAPREVGTVARDALAQHGGDAAKLLNDAGTRAYLASAEGKRLLAPAVAGAAERLQGAAEGPGVEWLARARRHNADRGWDALYNTADDAYGAWAAARQRAQGEAAEAARPHWQRAVAEGASQGRALLGRLADDPAAAARHPLMPLLTRALPRAAEEAAGRLADEAAAQAPPYAERIRALRGDVGGYARDLTGRLAGGEAAAGQELRALLGSLSPDRERQQVSLAYLLDRAGRARGVPGALGGRAALAGLLATRAAGQAGGRLEEAGRQAGLTPDFFAGLKAPEGEPRTPPPGRMWWQELPPPYLAAAAGVPLGLAGLAALGMKDRDEDEEEVDEYGRPVRRRAQA